MNQSSDVEVRVTLARELERLTVGDPFTALQLTYDADGDEVRAAFLTATKTFHPNRFGRRAEDVRELATEIFLVIKQSYHSLQTDESRSKTLVGLGLQEPTQAGHPSGDAQATPSTKKPKSRAGRPRRSFRRSRTESRKRHADGTSEQASVASGGQRPSVRLPRMPTAAEKAASEFEARQEQQQTFEQAVLLYKKDDFSGARSTFHELALLDSTERKYRVWMHYAWGREHQAAERADEARAEYNRALTLNPDFTEAKDAIASLDSSTTKRGVFSRLFRK